METYLGIDAGTTSLKAALFDLEGNLLAIDHQEYQLLTPKPAWVELDAPIYWQACCIAVRNVVRKSGLPCEGIRALAVSSQGETLVPVDKEGEPLRPAIVWLDNRAIEQAGQISSQFDVEHVYHVTGQPDIAPVWPACKILWIQQNEPHIFERAAKFLLVEDYLLYKLTGEFTTEFGLQTSSLLLDIQAKGWWAPMLDFVGVSADHLGQLAEPGAVVGPLSKDGARATGLSTQSVAVTGSLDQTVGAVGAGNIAPGVVTEATGGALAILATLPAPLYDDLRRVPCHYHARPDTYCLLPWSQTAGMALRWFRDQFFPSELVAARDAGSDSYDLMTQLAEPVPPGADGLVVLPHLEGAACPEFNSSARAVFFGATLRHTRGHFVRAIMESVAYMLKKNLDLVEAMGVPVTEVRSLGGGARSPLWLQIKADVLQKPVLTVETEDTACLGAAVLAAVATGAFDSLDDGVSRMVRLAGRVEPQVHNEALYRQGFGQYEELYDRLAPMFG